ncbi:MAG: hypothetical protein ACU836_10060 [Gammaproteobacteria bacterium]
MPNRQSLRTFATALSSLLLSTCAHASVFYKLEIAAENQLPGGFEQFNRSVSINDNGQLSFVAQAPPDPNFRDDGADVYIAERTLLGVGLQTRRVSYLPSCNTLDRISLQQMNNRGKIVLSFAGCGGTYWDRAVMVLDSNIPKELIHTNKMSVAGMNAVAGWATTHLGEFPTINNTLSHEVRNTWGFDLSGNKDGVCDAGETCVEQIAFARETGPYDAAHPIGQGYLSTLRQTGTFAELPDHSVDVGSSNDRSLPLSTNQFITVNARPRIADTGQIVVRDGNSPTDPIVLYDYELNPETKEVIAGAFNGFTSLGSAPNISADGKIVVFFGDRGKGMGVFASVDDGSPERKLIHIVGENNTPHPRPELGYNVIPGSPSTLQPLYFKSFRQTNRVGITHLAHGRPGMIGDSFVVGFTATPSGASRTNPVLGDRPITFTGQEGIWTVRVDIEEPLKNICVTPGENGKLDSVGSPLSINNPSEPLIPAGQKSIDVLAGSAGICPDSPLGDDESNYHVRTALPVVQVGDSIVGSDSVTYLIDTLATHDVLAAVTKNDAGLDRVVRPGDHRVAFFAASGNKQFIMSATHLDSDQDGLLDHWEEDGIDIDQDGVSDLDLKAMGADVCKRDLFVEIDWLNDQPGGLNRYHSNRPIAGVTQSLANMFDGAPAPADEDISKPCPIPAGIVTHIDGGHGLDSSGQPYSRNILSGPLEGGDRVVESTGTGAHINLVYMGPPNHISIPGLVARSLDDIKDKYFGTKDKRARELAYHYVVLADYYAFADHHKQIDGTKAYFEVTSSTQTSLTYDNNPNLGLPDSLGEDWDVIITSDSAGNRTNRSGQIRHVTKRAGTNVFDLAFGGWKVLPRAGDRFVLLNHSTGTSEIRYRQDYSTLPGNDTLITMGAFGPLGRRTPSGELGDQFFQQQTLAHELGHNFGLRHGGDDKQTSRDIASPLAKRDYLSLMNYLYQTCAPGRLPACPIETYSSSPIPPSVAFNDWQHLQMNFFSSGFMLANSLGATSNGVDITTEGLGGLLPNDELSITSDMLADVKSVSKLSIVTPIDDAIVALGQPLTVRVKTNSDISVASVTIYFDTDGNGEIDPFESLTADAIGPDLYEVEFPSLTGSKGWRAIRAQVEDSSGIFDEVTQGVSVVVGDVDGDGDVDQADVNLVLGLRGSQATEANDDYDVDDDGQITVLDARKLIALCTRPRCATN